MLSKVLSSLGGFIASTVNFVVYIVSRFFKVIALIAIGAITISLAGFVIASHFGLPYLSMITPNPAISGYIGFYAGLIALGIIPILLLIKTAINFIWNYKSTYKFKRAVSGVWIVSMTIFILTAVFTTRNFAHSASSSELVMAESIDTTNAIDLLINYQDYDLNHLSFQLGNTVMTDNYLLHKNGVSLTLKPSSDDKMSINKTTYSRGTSRKSALRSVKSPIHDITVEGNQIKIDKYYRIDRDAKFRGQKLSYDIYVPLGTKLNIPRKSSMIYNRAINRNRGVDTFIMTEEGIQPLLES